MVVHVMERVVVRAHEDRALPEALVIMADELRDKREAGKDSARRQHSQRHQHHHRAFMRVVIGVFVSARLAQKVRKNSRHE